MIYHYIQLSFDCWSFWQVGALKTTLKEFYGEDPLESADLSRIVTFNHFRRLTQLLDEDNIPEKIVHGGETNEKLL
jgi:aldehyde dehydrogenase (NAD+)